MNLPKKLQDRRDTLYLELLSDKECTCWDPDEYYCPYRDNAYDVQYGYKTACSDFEELVEAAKSLAVGCANTGYYGQLGISPGQCDCSRCLARKALIGLGYLE